MKFEKILPWKQRRPKGQREEYIWWKFWQKGLENKELLREKISKYAEKFEKWEAKSQNPYAVQEKEEERQSAMTWKEKRGEQNRKHKLEREKRFWRS